MTILIVGASGATGRLLVEHLLNRGHNVKVIVRSPDNFPENLKNHSNLTVIHANILEISKVDIAQHVSGCDAVASCLGHNISMKGVFGHPRRLVLEATRLLCSGINLNKSGKPTKFILMNTTANRNRDIGEMHSIAERAVLGLVRLLLPPQVDNEKAAEYLRVDIGQNNREIEWAIVRPDTLINADKVSEYEVYASPIRSPIFNAGSTSRINVGHFIADLITIDNVWNSWKGQMPVIYNTTKA